MSTDSSREVIVRLGEPSKTNGGSLTQNLASKGHVAVPIALQRTMSPEDVRMPAMAIPLGSGRPNIARLPVVEKEVYRIEGEVKSRHGQARSASAGRRNRTQWFVGGKRGR